MLTVTTIAAVRAQVAEWHASGDRVVFVPTMGNLHAGHVSLIEAARRHGKRFVASIFVNPMQFGPNEDFAHYPRTPTQDSKMLVDAGCDLMFMPEVGEIYPNGADQATRVEVPGISGILCGEFRPGHFEGVATVVAKLFNIVDADVAIFGEKDFQQLAVIRRMAQDLQLGVEILGHPTIRDADGLALSSRNAYLSADERQTALALPQALNKAAAQIQSGTPVADSLAQAKERLTAAGFARIDYVALVNALTLEPLDRAGGPMRLIAAAVIGRTRLIDNIAVDL